MAKCKTKRKPKPAKRAFPKLCCPLCGNQLDIKIEGFTCYAACGGPYLKGSIRLTCSKSTDFNDRCHYRYTTVFQADNLVLMSEIEKLVGNAINGMQDMGPWKVFKTGAKQ